MSRSSREPRVLPLRAAMSTPAKRHCRNPAGSPDSSFQKRLRKISIEGNIGERGGGEGAAGLWGQGALRGHRWPRRGWGGLFHRLPQGSGGILLREKRSRCSCAAAGPRPALGDTQKLAPSPGRGRGTLSSTAAALPRRDTPGVRYRKGAASSFAAN